MRVAYLFAESYPNYDIDFQVLSALSQDELNSLNTLVRADPWGLTFGQTGRTSEQIIQYRLLPLLYSGEGFIVRTKYDRLLTAIPTDEIYTVQFV